MIKLLPKNCCGGPTHYELVLNLTFHDKNFNEFLHLKYKYVKVASLYLQNLNSGCQSLLVPPLQRSAGAEPVM